MTDVNRLISCILSSKLLLGGKLIIILFITFLESSSFEWQTDKKMGKKLASTIFKSTLNQSTLMHLTGIIPILCVYILVWYGVDDTMTDEISEWIIGIKSLEILDLSSNDNLTEKGGRIILGAAAKSNLKEVILNGGAISTEWKGLLLDEIRQFIAAKNKQSGLNNQLKLLILGKERHGKTSLLHFLQQNKSIGTKTESTDGIDISQWILKRK